MPGNGNRGAAPTEEMELTNSEVIALRTLVHERGINDRTRFDRIEKRLDSQDRKLEEIGGDVKKIVTKMAHEDGKAVGAETALKPQRKWIGAVIAGTLGAAGAQIWHWITNK